MFWGLIMEPGKKYSQVVEKDFHIAQAALDLDSAQNSPVQVLISIDGRNYLVCTLIKDKVCQANLDLNFRAGVKVSFATNGPGHVHLTGYLIEDNEFVMEEDSDDDVEEEESADEQQQQQVPTKKRKAQQQNKNDKPNKKTKTAMLLDQLDEESYNEDEDSNVNLTDLMDDSDDESTDDEEAVAEDEDGEAGSDDDDDDDDDDDEEDDSEEEESSDEEQKPQQQQQQQKVSPKKAQESPKQNGVAKKTPKNEKVQKVDKTPKAGDKSPKNEKTPKGQKTPVQEKQKTPKSNQKSPGGGGGDSGSTPGKKQLEGGVMIEDLKVGEGPVAKNGRNVRVYYEGRLKTNNKVFDSSNKGPGFKFRLGRQEVIKAWDVGVVGMKPGGKRRIICPPNMAYGATGSPPVIPPNSTLVFEVELKQVL